MYESRNSQLGFSLRPPRWLRNIGRGVLGQTAVTVPTPVGPVVLTPAQVLAATRGTRVTVGGPPPPSPIEQAVAAVPGGMGTIAAVGIGVLLLFLLMPRRGR
mgnify:FL=1